MTVCNGQHVAQRTAPSSLHQNRKHACVHCGGSTLVSMESELQAEASFAKASGNVEVQAEGKRKRGRPTKLSKSLANMPTVEAKVDATHGLSEAASSIVHAETSTTISGSKPGSAAPPPAIQVKPGTLMPRVLAGLVAPSSLSNSLKKAAEQDHDFGIDVPLMSIAEDHLSGNFHLTSGIILEERYELELRAVKQRLERLACALCHMDRLQRAWLEAEVCKACPKGMRLYYAEYAAYDETPLFTSVKDVAAEKEVNKKWTGTSLEWMQAVRSSVRNPTQIAKLLQVQMHYAMVLASHSHMCAFIGETQCPLQVMRSTSTPVLKDCLLRLGGPSMSTMGFQMKCRSSVTDKAKSNIKCEKELAAERGGWLWQHYYCGLHLISTSHKKTFDMLQGQHITGLIWVSLCFRTGTAMASLREAIRSVVRARLKIKVANLTPQAKAYKTLILDVFLSLHTPAMVKGVLALSILNGDWQDDEFILHYVEPGQEVPCFDTIQPQVEHCLLTLFASCKPPIWPRHRWKGSELSVAHIALFDAVHGLLRPIFQVYLQLVGNPQHVTPAVDVCLGEDLGYEQSVLATGQAGDQDSMVCLHTSGDPADQVSLEMTLEQTDAADHAKRHAKQRQLAFAWVNSSSFPHLLLMGLVLRPFSELLNMQLAICKDKWELLERGSMAKAMLGGSMNLGSRKYGLVEAALGNLEAAFFKELNVLFNSTHIWQMFPQRVHNMSFRAEGFKMLARAGASVYQLYAHPHKTYPYKCFQMLHSAAAATEIASAPACVKDAWTSDLEAKFILAVTAVSQHTDIGHVESNHSSIRRHVMVKSVHTWIHNVADASCQFVMQRFRRFQCSSRLDSKRVVVGSICHPTSISSKGFVKF
eukprot:6491847-Amphidinium_carterae.1